MVRSSVHRSVRRRAFTLVEALTVVAIVAVIMPVAMYGISLATGSSALVRQKAIATQIANEQLATFIGSGDWLSGGGTNGTVSYPGQPEFRWETAVADWDGQLSTGVTVAEVRVTVTWFARGQDQSVMLSTLMYPGESTTTGL